MCSSFARLAYPASRGDGVGRARLHRARDAHASGQREAVLHRADVSARASAEGALPAVLPDWRRAAWAVRSSGARCGSHRDADGVFRAHRPEWRRAEYQLDWRQGVPPPICRAIARRSSRREGCARPDSQRRIETNPLRVLDSKVPEEQHIIEKLPRIAEHLCDACREHYAELKRQLALRGVGYQENWRLVRGLDYYMRTTFRGHRDGSWLAGRRLRRRALRRPRRAAWRACRNQGHRLRHRNGSRGPVA